MFSSVVRTVAQDEKSKVLDTFALAFADDPIMRWMLADGSSYLRHVGAGQFALGGRALEHGTGHCLEDFSAAAFWLPPGVSPNEEAMSAFIEGAVPENARGDLSVWLNKWDSTIPRHRIGIWPCWASM
jgi:hypothetical protein